MNLDKISCTDLANKAGSGVRSVNCGAKGPLYRAAVSPGENLTNVDRHPAHAGYALRGRRIRGPSPYLGERCIDLPRSARYRA